MKKGAPFVWDQEFQALSPFQLRRMVSLLFSPFCQFLVSQSTPVPQKIVELRGSSSIYDGSSPASQRKKNVSMKAGGVKH